jgi:hypothetical protein
MITITSKRVKGQGKGTEIGFPTINMELTELPEGVSVGLWSCATTWSNAITNISKSPNGFRLETHLLGGARFSINVGTMVQLSLISKLRAPSRTKDIYKLIESDKKLAKEFFNKVKTCENCELFYRQDYGYSNYTVEGSTYGCYAGKFEDIDGYGSNIEYEGVDCEYMREGEPWFFDVDGSYDQPDDEWIKSVQRDVKLNVILNG